MLRISTAALLLFETGFQIIFATSQQAHPGQLFTMWCSHNIYIPGDLYWFKQTDGDVPVTIVRMSYTDNLRKADETYFNDFTREHLVADPFNQSTTLTIRNVSISDSGFYFCGTTGDQIKFTDGTRLEVKVAECQTQQHVKEDDSVEYAAVHFSKKKPQNPRKHAEDSIYTDPTYTTVYTDTT
uniref:novel immune-type receptor 10b precursor n=1 Tax=Danio rerio TaxID=7955 RepID=UPI00004705E0|nr:novel immune-type receptor 10b precursor [Danio rerio]CAI21228.1 novel immune-type receptor 10.1 [Danio rerio]